MERRILVAHEDPDSRRIYRIALEYGGWSVVDTADGDEALELLRAHRFDAVLSDLFVRGSVEGPLVRQIRALPALAGVPVVVLTGWSSSEHEIQALREGADVFLVMPVTPERLLVTLDSLTVPAAGRATRPSRDDVASDPTELRP